jgi:hypothetical protein
MLQSTVGRFQLKLKITFNFYSINLVKINPCRPFVDVGLAGLRIGSNPAEFDGFFLLREEHKLRVFENRIMKRIFGLKRDENKKWEGFTRRT